MDYKKCKKTQKCTKIHTVRGRTKRFMYNMTAEDGSREGKIAMRLASQPKDTVLFTISSAMPDEASTSPQILAFSIENWGVEQTITVRGIDDPFLDGDVTVDFEGDGDVLTTTTSRFWGVSSKAAARRSRSSTDNWFRPRESGRRPATGVTRRASAAAGGATCCAGAVSRPGRISGRCTSGSARTRSSGRRAPHSISLSLSLFRAGECVGGGGVLWAAAAPRAAAPTESAASARSKSAQQPPMAIVASGTVPSARVADMTWARFAKRHRHIAQLS